MTLHQAKTDKHELCNTLFWSKTVVMCLCTWWCLFTKFLFHLLLKASCVHFKTIRWMLFFCPYIVNKVIINKGFCELWECMSCNHYNRAILFFEKIIKKIIERLKMKDNYWTKIVQIISVLHTFFLGIYKTHNNE